MLTRAGNPPLLCQHDASPTAQIQRQMASDVRSERRSAMQSRDYRPKPCMMSGPGILPLLQRDVYLSQYVVLDLFSRFVVAWMISRKENSALAKQLMAEATNRYGIAPGQLTLHQDRGSQRIAHGYLDLMRELDVTCSYSRPRVSNHNPFNESQFKTQKYQPDYPGQFHGIVHARQWCEDYFLWYNNEHHHSGLAGFTPEQVLSGRHHDVAKRKQRALDQGYERNPERYCSGTFHPAYATRCCLH